VLLITTLEDWRDRPEAQFRPGPERAAWVPDEAAALGVADDLFGAGQVVALILDPAPTRVPPPGVVDRAQVGEVRFLRRGPAGKHTEVLRQPPTARALDLLPHPEGGWFRETWKTRARFTPDGYGSERAAATGIYFLLPPGEESVWHAVRSDEVWLWHRGGPLTLLLGGDGFRPEPAAQEIVTLGPDVEHRQVPQALVPAGCWQAARPAGDEEVLVSCVVAPGFDFADFRIPG
jgi:predicted cupin superfamily sugar epimerase